jgi:hypothetical protein
MDEVDDIRTAEWLGAKKRYMESGWNAKVTLSPWNPH